MGSIGVQPLKRRLVGGAGKLAVSRRPLGHLGRRYRGVDEEHVAHGLNQKFRAMAEIVVVAQVPIKGRSREVAVFQEASGGAGR
jgi:hypothetical protein